jgi:acetyl esterase/lipase
MKLWSDEIEAERAEARAAVASHIEAFRAFLGGTERDPAAAAPVAVARRQRAHMNLGALAVPEAEPREIAGVPCRVFRPDGRARAVYLHFHGGGMVVGAPEMNDFSNREIARQHGIAVVSVDYRLAPEHPYPAGPDDGVAVARWLLEHAERELGSGRFVIGGESAGAYMSAAVLLRVRDELRAAERFIGANLVFGVYDWGGSPSQRGIRPHEGPDVLDPEGIRFFTSCYLPGRSEAERRDPAVSPAFADLRGLPSALMGVGTTDHLLDDTLMLAPRWAAAGNEVELFVAPDMPHGFLFFPCALTNRFAATTTRWFERIVG